MVRLVLLGQTQAFTIGVEGGTVPAAGAAFATRAVAMGSEISKMGRIIDFRHPE